MKNVFPSALVVSLLSAMSIAPAQAQDTASFNLSHAMAHAAAANQVVHLSASAQTEVPEDWLVMTLSVQLDGVQAAGVQKQLNAVVTAAIATAKPSLRLGAAELSTGNMNVSPRYGRDGKIQGWTGVAQVVLQGRDAEQIASLAGRLEGLSVSNIAWRLSTERKKDAESQLLAEAVESFRNKAQSLAKHFGFVGYTLREVRISAQEAGEGVMPRMAMAQMDASVHASVPTVSGKSKVVVNASGSIQLR